MRERALHSQLGDGSLELPDRFRDVLKRNERDTFQAWADGQKLLVQEVVVGAAECRGKVGLAHPPDAEPGGGVEDRRLHFSLVHESEPCLGVARLAPEPATEGAVPAVLGVVGATTGPVAAVAVVALEIRSELLGRLGDVPVSVSRVAHRSLPGKRSRQRRIAPGFLMY